MVSTIADNGSTDDTWAIATELATQLPGVHAVRLELPGRGRALKTVWSRSDAEVLAYMDVDLSTDLNALLPLVEDTGWFFDTELLVLAERSGLRIHEVPVDWVDELVRPDATPLPLGPVRARGWLTGREHDPRWVRPALLALLAGTAALYILGLGANGWANSFYTAAVQAGTQSWKAFFFGSFDAANFITVDKPPGSLWLTGLSARMFGVNAWSILVPQALAGVATVGLLYATVRRHFSAAAGLLAGAALALTPVATLMFRYNNPDALLVLLLVAGAYAVTRATETASARWLALAGVLVGFGFLTKALQALLVVPAFTLVYLLAAPTSLGRRLGHLVLAGVAMLAAGQDQ